MFIFPVTQGRIATSDNPAGTIRIGQTITVAYALKLIRSGRARFIGVDASKLPTTDLKMTMRVQQASQAFGFIVKDTRQPNLNISISPTFMDKVKDNFRETVARSGNLSITLAPVAGGFKILQVVLD